MVTGNTRVPGARGARARTASKDRVFAAMQRTRAQPRGGPVVGSMQRTSTRLRPWRRGYHVRRKLEQLYDVGEELGHGGYSLVRLSTHKVSGEPLQGPCASMQPSRLAPSGAGRQSSLKYTAPLSVSPTQPRGRAQACRHTVRNQDGGAGGEVVAAAAGTAARSSGDGQPAPQLREYFITNDTLHIVMVLPACHMTAELCA